MTDGVAPTHLNNHHRETLASIFRHPTGHNIEWLDVLSLLEAVGTVDETSRGKYVVKLGGQSETFTKPNHKDIDVQTVLNLRRMLKHAGYETDTE